MFAVYVKDKRGEKWFTNIVDTYGKAVNLLHMMYLHAFRFNDMFMGSQVIIEDADSEYVFAHLDIFKEVK